MHQFSINLAFTKYELNICQMNNSVIYLRLPFGFYLRERYQRLAKCNYITHCSQ